MPHKKHSLKLAGGHHAAGDITKASSKIGPQPLTSTKHSLSDDAEEVTASGRSEKRRRTDNSTGLHHGGLLSSDIPTTSMIEENQTSKLSLDINAPELSPEIRHLSTKYDFTTMSILSSAKINHKVKNLLLRVENFSFADPKCKPGIVVLHAKSDVASKMVSIVEIARQDIERNNGKWWQYSKLHGQVTELKVKSVKRKGDGKTLAEWQKERASEKSQGTKEVEGEGGRASEEIEYVHGVIGDDEEMEDAFESMANSRKADDGAKESGIGSGRKVRAIPVMTIYFARVPVPGLKELYGYAPI